MVLVELSGVPVQAGAAPAGTPTVVVDGAVVQAATPLAITPAVALEDHIVAVLAIYRRSTMAQTGVSGPVVVDGESFLDALFASAGQG